ncbi:MAG: hypothetical protein CVU44_04695 [Chloroflexi bacterium HGW-Chloroflexi-6]|nr:MAG: hypothetical protein CVU44_04695 [Chloroflexi bacterium HGW-Chloroflexi-6]
MTQKLRIPLIFLLLSVLALGGLAFQVAAPFFQIATPTPEGQVIQAEEEDSEALLEQSQAANSDGIAFLGILIFVIILVPLLVLRKDW